MTLYEQYSVATKTKDFLSRWGLKKKYVAKVCGIPETEFSRFINGKLALNSCQLTRVTEYVDDYTRRNS